MSYPHPRPVTDRPEVRALCQELVPDEIPVVLGVDAPPWAQAIQCTDNVDRVIAEHGGQIEYGWRLWETIPDVMIEAEFHAVWLDADGRRHDVTPTHYPAIKETVFLPDTKLVYEGRQIDNVRRSLVDDTLVKQFIEAAEAWFEVTNRGELADYHGQLKLTPEMRTIRRRQEQLQLQILKRYFS